MKKKDFLSGPERELYLLAEDYDRQLAEGKRPYMDAGEAAELADFYSRRHQLDKAIDLTDYALGLHPGNTTLLVQKTYLCLDNDDFDGAMDVFKCIAEEDDEVTILKAYLQMNMGDFEAAEESIREVREPDELYNVIDIAYAYADNGCPRKGVEYIEARPEKVRRKEECKACLADCLWEIRHYEEAAKLYDELIDLNPYSASYWYGLARCQYDLGEYDKAIESCDFALVSDDENGDIYMHRGNCFAALGNTEEAERCYEKAVAYNAAPAFYIDSYRGLNAMDRGDFETGRTHLERVLYDYHPTDPTLLSTHLYSLAFCLYQLGYREEAFQKCEEAVSTMPESNFVVLGVARLYAFDGNLDRATELWELAEKNDPGSDTLEAIGQTCVDAGHPKLASSYFDQAARYKAKATPGFDPMKVAVPLMAASQGDKVQFFKYADLYLPELDEIQLQEIGKLIDRIAQQGPDEKRKLIEQIAALIDDAQRRAR